MIDKVTPLSWFILFAEMVSLKYLFSKLIYKFQIPSCRNCEFASHVKVLPKTNLLNVKVGKYTYIGANNSMQNVEIGSFCSIGSYVAAGGGIHPMDRPATSTIFYDPNNCFRTKLFINNSDVIQPKTIIGNDVWIGDNVYIKAGVNVGDGVIIGAHSVVTHDVPPYAIVAGVPARIIKYRFNDDIITKFLAEKWWDWETEDIIKKKELLSAVDKFMKI